MPKYPILDSKSAKIRTIIPFLMNVGQNISRLIEITTEKLFQWFYVNQMNQNGPFFLRSVLHAQ